jgi:basic amino acid/polyamine antiporter, APA family
MTLTYGMTVGAVIILRRTQPDRPRPYRCFGYPWLPVIYLLFAFYFVVSTLVTKPQESMEGLALACLGVPLYIYWRERRFRPRERPRDL